MEPGRETIRSVAFAIGLVGLALSIGLFLADLRSMHLAMALRVLAPAILQAFALFLFRESFSLKRPAADKPAAGSAHLPRVG
ncbi:hypothetical protein LMIY3S_02142 [Labrys miyagiensis]